VEGNAARMYVFIAAIDYRAVSGHLALFVVLLNVINTYLLINFYSKY